MTNTINLELSKRLNELGLLDNIGTEFVIEDSLLEMCYDRYYEDNSVHLGATFDRSKEEGYYKTLILEEVIEFLPSTIKSGYINTSLKMDKWDGKYTYYYSHNLTPRYNYGKTPLEAIEKLIIFLLDNNLIGTK